MSVTRFYSKRRLRSERSDRFLCGGGGSLLTVKFLNLQPLIRVYLAVGIEEVPMSKTTDLEKPDKLLARLLKHVRSRPKRGCWVWNGATVSRPGHSPYGYLMASNHRHISARRLSYILHGLTPELGDGTVEASCGNSLCIAPHHLYRSARRKQSRRSV